MDDRFPKLPQAAILKLHPPGAEDVVTVLQPIPRRWVIAGHHADFRLQHVVDPQAQQDQVEGVGACRNSGVWTTWL